MKKLNEQDWSGINDAFILRSRDASTVTEVDKKMIIKKVLPCLKDQYYHVNHPGKKAFAIFQEMERLALIYSTFKNQEPL